MIIVSVSGIAQSTSNIEIWIGELQQENLNRLRVLFAMQTLQLIWLGRGEGRETWTSHFTHSLLTVPVPYFIFSYLSIGFYGSYHI